MGLSKEYFIKQQAQEIEAEKVAREVPMLTLESEYMWKLLKECRDSFQWIVENENWSYIEEGSSATDLIALIDKLEKDLKC